jgi:HlyD family secretion protein
MKIFRRLLFYLLLTGIVGALLLGARTFVLQRESLPPDDADSAIIDETVVEVSDLRVTVGATGVIAPRRQLPLTFEVPGIVAEVFVSEGDRVQAGQVIARLETDVLETALASAQVAYDTQQIALDALTQPPREADLAAAQAAVYSAQASLNAAYATAPTEQQLEIARLQAELSRNQLWQAQLQRDLSASLTGIGINLGSLIPEGVEIPQEVVNQANQALASAIQVPGVNTSSLTAGLNQAEFGVQIADANLAAAAGRTANPGSIASAQAALTSAQAALDALQNGPSELDLQLAALGVQQAQLAIDQAQLALDRAQIVAPFDGIVARLNLTVGEPPPIASGDVPVVLVDTSEYRINLSIDETDIVRLQENQPVSLRFDALPDETITGIVSRIDPVPVIAGQLVTFPVQVTIDATDAQVRLGMSATATIVVDELENVLVLPNRFIRIDRATQDAFVTIESSPGRFEEVQVELGLRNETSTQIVSGVEAGQRIVLLPRGTFDPFAGR